MEGESSEGKLAQMDDMAEMTQSDVIVKIAIVGSTINFLKY